ncbi:unnamed protein product [Effrenium voratum]|nr:unnamed protein product [Effrenium voratum]
MEVPHPAVARAKRVASGRSTVSLFVFGEAIEHAAPSCEREMCRLATELGGPDGMEALKGHSAAEVLSVLEPAKAQRLLLWLPKHLDGSIDWQAAEEWRRSAERPS